MPIKIKYMSKYWILFVGICDWNCYGMALNIESLFEFNKEIDKDWLTLLQLLVRIRNNPIVKVEHYEPHWKDDYRSCIQNSRVLNQKVQAILAIYNLHDLSSVRRFTLIFGFTSSSAPPFDKAYTLSDCEVGLGTWNRKDHG